LENVGQIRRRILDWNWRHFWFLWIFSPENENMCLAECFLIWKNRNDNCLCWEENKFDLIPDQPKTIISKSCKCFQLFVNISYNFRFSHCLCYFIILYHRLKGLLWGRKKLITVTKWK
jgi:hypothetical protein